MDRRGALSHGPRSRQGGDRQEDEHRQAGARRTARRGDADPAALLAKGRVLPPIDHPDPAHLLVTGTGLTHLGSAATRDSMHAKAASADEAALTDSMKMFRMGLEGGKPAKGETGVQPEWFYKGDGSFVAAPGKPLVSPAFGEDGGEEPEVAGIYLVGRDGQPWRIGFALLNEFSDHVMERQNYLFLAHSKLRPCCLRTRAAARRPARRHSRDSRASAAATR